MKILLLCLALAGPIALVGCAPKTFQTPQAKSAYTADQVVIRLGELQNVIIDGQKAGVVPLATARDLVTWIAGDNKLNPPVLGAVDVLKAAPDGWKATIQTGWAIARLRLMTVTELSQWVSILDPLIEGVTQ